MIESPVKVRFQGCPVGTNTGTLHPVFWKAIANEESSSLAELRSMMAEEDDMDEEAKMSEIVTGDMMRMCVSDVQRWRL